MKAVNNDNHQPVYPAQCSCGHFYTEKYQWKEPVDGYIGFCWCKFCRTGHSVKVPSPSNDSDGTFQALVSASERAW